MLAARRALKQVASGGGSPIALVAHAGAGSSGGGNVTTSAMDTSGASLLVAAVSAASGTPGLSDSKGNTWVQMAAEQGGKTTMFYVKNPTVGSGHTFSTTMGAGSFGSIAVVAFSGTNTTQNVDQTNGFASGGGTTFQPGSVTPSQNGEVIVTSTAPSSNPSTASIDSGFTITDFISFLSGNHFGIGLAYLVQTTAGVVNPTWTLSVANAQAGSIGTFKHA